MGKTKSRHKSENSRHEGKTHGTKAKTHGTCTSEQNAKIQHTRGVRALVTNHQNHVNMADKFLNLGDDHDDTNHNLYDHDQFDEEKVI
jgi:hypothetical protein